VLLARRARALKRHLREASLGNGHGVHQARVASRRLREAVPVFATDVKGGKSAKARKKIRRVTRALGAIRELDVTVALLDELAAQDGVPRVALEDVRAHVLEEQERRRSVMLKRLGRVKVDKLERRLAALGEALEETATEEWRRSLAARLLKRAKLLRSAVDEAGQLYEAERLHAVRIAAKKLRYAAEVAADAGVKTAARPVRTIKHVQDTLGRLHDLQVLQTHIATVQAMPRRSQTTDTGLHTIARKLEDECRHLHAKYAAGVPALKSAIDDIRALVIPDLQRARTRRAVKMKLPRAAVRRPPQASGH
jgi:CHAD domain-containing protein